MGTPHRPSSPLDHAARRRLKSPAIIGTENTQIERRSPGLILDTDDPWHDNEAGNCTDFADQMADTFRNLVQHALVTTIFLTRLFTLPFMYIAQKVAWPQDRAWLAVISYPVPRNATYNDAMRPPNTEPTLRKTLLYITSVITLPFRMTRDLYRICNLLQKHPTALERIGSRQSQRSEVFELHNFQRPNRRILPGVSTHNLVGPPAPTEVYHAALSERGDLNEVLAAFDLNNSSHESLISNKDYQTSQSNTEFDHLRSLQTTPPELLRSAKQPGNLAPTKLKRLHPDGFACFDSVSHSNQDSLAPPSTGTIAPTPKVWDRLSRMDDQRHMSLPDEYIGHDIQELLGETDNLERCPTYIRRHRRSLLPRRLGTRSAVDLASGAMHVRQDIVPFKRDPAPRKGAKLKKRRPVPALANKSSMTSPLKRF